ncbi:MAG TPA: transketolase [Thermodesulfobacteriota bacterium]|nr:transketolase [Thermodesulfobacteriota bacterium]
MDLDQLCVNTIRMLSVDMVQEANSGHPGLPLGAAPMAYVLWTKFLKHNPENPKWPDRDRFVLSAGHGSALLYSLLHLTGYDLPLEEIKRFRQWGSKTPGHPEYGDTPGVECTTGPLGQGFAMGVGMALAERFLAAHFNRPGQEIVDHYTYGLVSDGDLMEGVASEAASLAGHLKLGKLIYLYDQNSITLAGETRLVFTEDVARRFEAYGWQVQAVENGNDLEAIARAIEKAREENSRPSLISVRTHIGYGSPLKHDTFEAHGSPLGAEEVAATKKNLGWPLEPKFFIPEEVRAHFHKITAQGAKIEEDWEAKLRSYQTAFPELRKHWDQWMKLELPGGWEKDIPVFPVDPKGVATRAAGGKIMNALAPRIPFLIGGSGDLNPSTNTVLKGRGNFQAPRAEDTHVQGAEAGPWSYAGANLHFGVREHAMGSILNGMALHGGILPYGSTFLIFSDYMRPAIRLAALMKLRVIYVFTHDSVALGEDGPTHQPVEHIASLRAIPGLTVIRPADANEAAEAWKVAIQHEEGPVALLMTRQSIPVIDRTHFSPAEGLKRGAYVLADSPSGRAEVLILASGSEVQPALAAYQKLKEEGISSRLVSMPSWELFEKQPEEYRIQVVPRESLLKVSIEAGATLGWHKYVGPEGEAIGIDHFGASAPVKVILEKFGFTPENIMRRVKALLARRAQR